MRRRSCSVHSMVCSTSTEPRCVANTSAASSAPEVAAEALAQRLGPLARVERGAVGGDGDDGVVGPEVEQLGRLDGGEHVADRREAEVAERGDDLGGHALAVDQVGAPLGGVEQHVELVGGPVADTPTTTSVFITLWMSGMCLSPMPWMLCSPKPFSSIVGHSSASTATMRGAVLVLQAVAGGDGAGRAGGRREGRQAQAGVGRGDVVEHAAERPPGDLVVAEVVAELAELVEHEVARVEGELVAGVVDLLHVALAARRADDVGRVGAPSGRASRSAPGDMPAGRMATPRQPMMRLMATPPRA